VRSRNSESSFITRRAESESFQKSVERERSSSSAKRRRLAASSKALLERLEALFEAGDRRSLRFAHEVHPFLAATMRASCRALLQS
jgi:hypothetical protein